ncbi:hypothetical protein [Haloferula sp.]|uniref:hypothetical protein n=1 Tax=Haloferula sp. TaxID=2497595 RepID=UPI003C791E3F
MKEAGELVGRGGSLLLAGVGVALAGGVWWRQNRGGAPGGGISAAKAAWLAYAIVLWILLPLLLLQAGLPFVLLAASMVLRAAIEIPLCATGRWRVAYGVGHDVFHLLLLGFVSWQMPVPGLAPWVALTAVSLLCELCFVRWFVKATGGPKEGVFYVPPGRESRWIHRWTAALLVPQLTFLLLILLHNFR